MNPRDLILRRDRAHVWHPYTQMQDYLEKTEPLVLESARGSRLFDVNGRQYIDANASWYCSALGHQHPRLVRALTEQADLRYSIQKPHGKRLHENFLRRNFLHKNFLCGKLSCKALWATLSLATLMRRGLASVVPSSTA